MDGARASGGQVRGASRQFFPLSRHGSVAFVRPRACFARAGELIRLASPGKLLLAYRGKVAWRGKVALALPNVSP